MADDNTERRALPDAPAFEPMPQCVKCVAKDNISQKFCEKATGQGSFTDEWIEHKCGNCGFTWNTAPADDGKE